jgi:putative DNA primase/helicase
VGVELDALRQPGGDGRNNRAARPAMTAETIAKALGGRKAGGGWIARCPTHDDRDPSLSIRDADDGKVLVRCHAGCDQQKVIAALKARGIWQRTDRQHGTLIRSQPSPAAKDEPDRDDAERTRTALRLWGASVAASGTLVETYLRSRGIVMPIPAELRFHGGTKHARGKFWACGIDPDLLPEVRRS